MTSTRVDGAPGLAWDQLGVQSRRPLPQAPAAGAAAGTAFRSAGCGCTCVNNVPVIGPRCPVTSCAGLSDLHPAPSLQDRPLVRLRPSQGDPQSSPQQDRPGHPDSRSPLSHSHVPVLSVTNTAPLRRTSCFCSRPPARVKFQGVGWGPQEAHPLPAVLGAQSPLCWQPSPLIQRSLPVCSSVLREPPSVRPRLSPWDTAAQAPSPASHLLSPQSWLTWVEAAQALTEAGDTADPLRPHPAIRTRAGPPHEAAAGPSGSGHRAQSRVGGWRSRTCELPSLQKPPHSPLPWALGSDSGADNSSASPEALGHVPASWGAW